MNKHFWNWTRDETNPEERTLLLEGPIAEESWYGDEVTPAVFREELFSADGPIVISVNSPGGDTIAASQIYTMLREYPGDVTVKITGIAASAASVIAMAGTKVCMSPTAMMMIHNPFTIAMGDSEEMRRAGSSRYRRRTMMVVRRRLSPQGEGDMRWYRVNNALCTVCRGRL